MPEDDGIPRFDCNKLVIKDRIGHGAFGDVFTADYQAPGEDSKETVVLKKMINAMDAEEKKLFIKEVALLSGLNHPNVVRFMSVCHQPPAMMLEYVYFDFNLFGADVRVSTLSDFLIKVDEYDSVGFQELICHAATEIISGLAYLHQTGIAHRDLKTANILVSNQHYSSVSESQDLHEIYHERPIACKLTDFGESRSLFIQTQLIVSSKTTTVDRGTVVYMSPELLVEEKRLTKASIADLIMADVWALGMVIFTLLNPSLKSPYILEMRAEGVRTQEQLKKFITELLRNEKLPQHDEKYDIDRATVWFALEEVFRGCLNFNREKRLSLQEAAQILARRHDRFSMDFQVINLRVSQATALEQFDQKVAVEFQEQAKSLQSNVMPINDGTNACAFLSIGVAESIIQKLEGEVFFEKLPAAVESIIWSLPEKINEHRDMGNNYDVLEAYEILRRRELIKSPLEFSEELPYAYGVFTNEGREKLFSKLCVLGTDCFVAVYTSDPLVLTIGCHNGKPYVIDTHPVAPPAGNGNGIVLVGNKNTPEVWMSICVWLWQRLHHGGVSPTTAQSLAVVTLDPR